VVVRVRRVQGKGDDSVVKLRPVIPHDLPKGLRQLAGFVVEVDAMPGGYMCSASLKGVARAPWRQGDGGRRATHPQAVHQGPAALLRRARRRDRARRPVRAGPPSGAKDFKRFDAEFAATNRLRTQGTDHLLAGAKAAGVARFIAQSFGNWNYERSGSGPKTEQDPLDPDPPANQRRSLEAIRYLEAAVMGVEGLEGIALRYGNFYGPGTGFALDGDLVALVRKRRLPIVGNGAGVWSFTHMDDVATATIAAIERGGPGIYNIADDEPAPVAVWLPELARAVGAKPPRHVPVWVGRLVVGEVGVSMMTQIRGASNAKAKRELGWAPRYASWREGFRTGLDNLPIE
jgi:nucleoside-diphosphate-sugar epimerase